MKKQVFTNTFSGGMVQDTDSSLQSNDTYRHSIGGRIIQNVTENQDQSLEENVKAGVSRAYVVAKGNKFVLTLCPDYKFIGSCEVKQGAVIFSTNGTNGEIGLLEVNSNVYKTGFAKYTPLFNDRNDPNRDLLHFDRNHYINGSFSVSESQFSEKVYWVDGINQKRVINLKDFYRQDGTTYHNQENPCTSGSTYPKHLSVHAFDDRMDVVFPKMKFWKRIPGKLKSGQYQLVCKYLSKNGHSSVWSHLSRPVFVTTEKMDGDITVGSTKYTNAYKTNHHNRTMGASNIMTEEGQEWILEGLDQRWDQIVIGYVYHESSTAFQEATRYKVYNISSSVISVDLVSHTGIGITKEELNQRFETILEVGSTAQQENRTWDGNIKLLQDMTIDLSGVTIKPKPVYFKADITVQPNFAPTFNPVSGRNDNDPFTNTIPTDGDIFNIQNFTGDQEVYRISDDYANYKGQMFNYLYKGYFRGETQPFGFLWIDRKGNPIFVQHITDFTFPQQFDTKDENGNATDWTLSKSNSDGSYDLRAMGAMFSNIKIPKSILYDKYGKLNVSGFMIVRTERIARIANQGVLLNCYTTSNGKTDSDTDRWVQPTIWYSNEYMPIYWNGSVPNGHLYSGASGNNYKKKQNLDGEEGGLSSAHYFNYHSPDILIEQKLPQDYLAAQMQLVGFAHAAYIEKTAIRNRKNHVYTKNVRSLPLSWPRYLGLLKFGRPKLGDKSRIKLAFLHTKGKFGIYSKDEFDPEASDIYDYRANTWATLFWNSNFTDNNLGTTENLEIINDDSPFSSTQQPNSVIMKLQDFESVDVIEDKFNKSTYRTANMLVTPPSYYTGADESSLETRRYLSTGHFQPITQEILDKTEKEVDAQGNLLNYVFNNVEVWGGDCYVNLFDFTRLYPEYSDCSKFEGRYPNYSLSHIVPIESKYNLALLYGRRFAANSVYPQEVACDNQDTHMSNGINSEQTESWSYNEVLNLQENTKFYFPAPSEFKQIENQDSTIRWSPKKIYGELEDSYRQRLVDDYADIIGEYGAITKICQGFDYLYILQERAFGAAMTTVDRFVPTSTGDIMVKSGDAFGGIRYISKVYGTQHPNSVTSFDNKISFTDVKQGKILVFNQAGLKKQSETDFLDNPITAMTIYFDREIVHQNDIFVDIISGVDIENEEILTSFIYRGVPVDSGQTNHRNRQSEVKSFTVGYSSALGVWQGYQHFVPGYYFNVFRLLFSDSPKPGKENELYVYNHGNYGQWFEDYYDTIVEFIVNVQPNTAKVFDNSWINVNEDGYPRIYKAIHRTEKNVHTINLLDRELAEYIEGSLRYATYEEDFTAMDDKPRLRGNFMVSRIFIQNNQQSSDSLDLQVAITNIDTLLRLSSPLQY